MSTDPHSVALPGDTAICTWFVADAKEDATFFPQVSARSDAPEVQALYWRCVMCFFASSLMVNPGRRHIFFTNTDIPIVDGIDLASVLAAWAVEIVRLPITYRLPRGHVSMWGNQFYIFDILRYIASAGTAARYVVLDSDCIWLRPADEMERAIDAEGALTYLLEADEHPIDMVINGLSRRGMAAFLGRIGGPERDIADYFGGELFAATRPEAARISAAADRLWPDIVAGAPDAPREEAHTLSVIYALNGYHTATANRFVRRLWTNFRRNNLRRDDVALTIWHLPREKRGGFLAMFRRLAPAMRAGRPVPHLTLDDYRRLMGHPRRSPGKFAVDLAVKLREKIAL